MNMKLIDKDDKYFVSVIVPNYSHAKFLDQRIQSILNQTYQNFELIILDDCSPDNGASKTVIEKYRDNPHVSHIVYNETNSGSTFIQWDKGINLAKGNLIWIAESDDFCELTLLKELVNQIEESPSCSLAYTLSQNVDEYGNIIGKLHPIHSNKIVKGSDFIKRYMSIGNPVYNASSALFRRDVALSINPLYKEYKGGGDRLFWIEIAEKGHVAIVNKPLNYCRQHLNKVTPQKMIDGTNIREAHRTYEYILSHFHFSSLRRTIIRGHYIFLIKKTQIMSETIRNELYVLWGYQNWSSNISIILGRFVSLLRNRFNIYI